MQEPSFNPKPNSAPYKNLGTHLKYVREQKSETLAEAAGAVEIDLEKLERIESGAERPSEDILMLLINHFGMQDQEAVQLWEAAGYERDSESRPKQFEHFEKNAAVVILAVDVRTQYSDGIDIKASPSGVVMQFTQSTNAHGAQPVAKVGMSQEQARLVLQSLQAALLKAKYLDGPKLLPPNTESN